MNPQIESFLDQLNYQSVPDEWVNNTPKQGLLFRIGGHPNWQITEYQKDMMPKLLPGWEKTGHEYEATPILHAFACWELASLYYSARHLEKSGEGIAFISLFKAHPDQQFYLETGLTTGVESDKIGDITKFNPGQHYETNIDRRNEYLSTHVWRRKLVKKRTFLDNITSGGISEGLLREQIDQLSQMMASTEANFFREPGFVLR